MKKYNIYILLFLTFIATITVVTYTIRSWPILNRTITIATPPEDINSFAVKEVEWALSCDENYSDACQSVFWYCGASDFPNKKYDTYTRCVVQEYREFTFKK